VQYHQLRVTHDPQQQHNGVSSMSNNTIKALKSACTLAYKQENDNLVQELALVMSKLDSLQEKLMELAESAKHHDIEAYARIVSQFSPVDTEDQSTDLVFVLVKATVKNKDLDEDDKHVEGRYIVEVPSFLSDSLQAAVALDNFHEENAIAVLDDFEISTVKYLSSADNYENYSLTELGEYRGAA
jgi:hypothetical protein